jgi:hypothetical protein
MTVIEFAALVLASTLAHQENVVKSSKDAIEISNVCIKILPGYQYNIVNNVDYFRINISYNGATAYVYIGHNPEMLDANRKWQSRSIRAKMKSSKVVSLEGAQLGHLLGIPLNEYDQYFHLWFKDADSRSMDPIKKIVGFCR